MAFEFTRFEVKEEYIIRPFSDCLLCQFHLSTTSNKLEPFFFFLLVLR